MSAARVGCCVCALALAPLGCGSKETLYIGLHETDGALEGDASGTGGSAGTGGSGGGELVDCEGPVAPPAELSANGFYAKYVVALEIPILASDLVEDQALLEACSIVTQMLSLRPEVAQEMVQNGARVAIMGEDEGLTDLPGFEALGPEWDDERGAGATLDRPLTAAAEENLLCLRSDVYFGEIILVHSLAHAMRSLGIRPLEDDFDPRLETLYEAALSEGKWQDTYAGTSYPQYWAEGVQSWFGVNLQRNPADGIHNWVNTPEELVDYDPGLFELISEYLPEALSVSCF